MRCIYLKNTNPYFCLAAEEYLLKNFEDDIFMLWQSENTVVVGKHQNALAEINYPYVRSNKIKVARRISGGGTVFHDAGNVNFTFIKNVSSPAEISFKIFTEPVIKALAKLGVIATTSGRNDLLIGDLKISGNAEHIYKNRVLHHGTLLYDADLRNLGLAIKVIPGKYQDKAVQSNRSPVTNISSFLKEKISVEDFIHFLLKVQLEDDENTTMELTENDLKIILDLTKEKFETWEWNFGYSPRYVFKNTFECDNKFIAIELEVVKGIIESCRIKGDYFSPETSEKLMSVIKGNKHGYDEIQRSLERILIEVPSGLIDAFF